MTARRGIFVAPFDELADPNTLAELAASAEAHGWDGLFVWDHVRYRAPVRAVADPWVALAAVAAAPTGSVLVHWSRRSHAAVFRSSPVRR
jgi:alkanesulfonate monooxygenase SsuD/methylene tetrahydromethanopterin reductase-like flavin-dependent oxidoreductase (luciferase family)